jgi:cytochrome c-type biogenesis protein
LGAGTPLMVLGGVSRASLLRSRGMLASLGRVSKTALGTLFVVLGVVILFGYDRNIESALLSVSPMWLTRLTTSI